MKVTGSSGKTTCNLNIQGNSAGDGIKSALLSCKGPGTVTVAVHQQLKEVLVLKGVEKYSAARKFNCALQGDPCLLLLCSSDAEFITPFIHGVKPVRGIFGVLCFDEVSKITLRKGRFTSSGMPNVGIFGYQTSVLVDECTFQGNSAKRHGAGLLMDGGTLRVQSSTFKGNTAVVADNSNGGALWLRSGSTTIFNSTFHSNEANNGGAIFITDRAMVSIQGSQFFCNKAGSNGAAIFAEGTTQVDILPAAMQTPGKWVRRAGQLIQVTALSCGGWCKGERWREAEDTQAKQERANTSLWVRGWALIAERAAGPEGGRLRGQAGGWWAIRRGATQGGRRW